MENKIRLEKALNKFKTGTGKFAILGDSITDTHCGWGAGGASDGDHGYPQLLHKYVQAKFGKGIQFANLGRGGNTVLQASERADTLVIPENYDIVGLALGTNDWNLQYEPEVMRTQYIELIEKLLAKTDSALFMISLGYFHDWKSEFAYREAAYNTVIFEIAEQYSIPVIDTRAAMLQFMEETGHSFAEITLTADPVHPNDLGHVVWAKACQVIFDEN